MTIVKVMVKVHVSYVFNFNLLDKLVEAYEENKKLYERLVQVEKRKVGCRKNYLDQINKA